MHTKNPQWCTNVLLCCTPIDSQILSIDSHARAIKLKRNVMILKYCFIFIIYKLKYILTMLMSTIPQLWFLVFFLNLFQHYFREHTSSIALFSAAFWISYFNTFQMCCVWGYVYTISDSFLRRHKNLSATLKVYHFQDRSGATSFWNKIRAEKNVSFMNRRPNLL
jgi:hypothetical protein